MERHLRQRLAGQLNRAGIVLFTGAGFSSGARNRGGDSLPTGLQLRDALWPIAFPGRELDDRSSLGDTFGVALRQNQGATNDLLERVLTVDPESLPDYYQIWFAAPWSRAYTVNMDTLDLAVARRFDLPRELLSVSGLDDDSVPTETRLQCVHLNGLLSDFPNTTFSFRQYGERASRADFWYHHLVRQMNGLAVVFVGTQLDEPPLWQHLELRGPRGRQLREMRPGSYLVSPSLTDARAAMLEEFNVNWIQMDAETFAADVLEGLSQEMETGLRAVLRRDGPRRDDRLLGAVSELRLAADPETREFLMGREPVWADFGEDGYAVERAFEEDLRQRMQDEAPSAVVVTGTAGTGKSTTLMRLALELDSEGKDVRWLDLGAETPIRRVRTLVATLRPDVVVIDDLDRLGRFGGPLVSDLIADNDELLCLVAARSSRLEGLDLEAISDSAPTLEFTVPNLDDADIDGLLDALTDAGRLGALRGMTRVQQQQTMRGLANRQLLVAMIEATTGRRFDEKIQSECSDLGPDAGLIYAVAAIATTHRHALTRHELMLAASNDNQNEVLNRIQAMIDRHLLVQAGDGYRVRHRMIGERALEWFRQQGQLGPAVGGLMFAMATEVSPPNYTHTRPGRILARTMNHNWLKQMLNERQIAIREAYDGVQHLMDWDPHYWLQRGSYEVESGDIAQAENFLEQARSLAPDDYKVQTEWAYMMLVKATQNPDSAEAGERVEAAFEALEDAIEKRGDTDAYPFHVMGNQGLNWLRESSLGTDEAQTLLARLRYVANEGLRLHPRDAVLRLLERDLDAARLALAAIEAEG